MQSPSDEASRSSARRDLVARASVTICASPAVTWRVLMTPETIPQIFPVSEVLSPWAVGEPFTWLFSLGPHVSKVEGRVLRVLHERLLEYEYLDPHSRDVHGVNDNRHHVVIQLEEEASGTRVTVTQDENVSEEAQAHAEGGFRLALNHLKWLVEKRGSSA